MNILKMEHITKSFYGVYANEDVSLSLDKGEILALLGENGAGKTTIMNILFGIQKPDSGKIIWKGEEVKFSTPKDAIAKGIGMVHQHFSLVDSLTVTENIVLGLSDNNFILDRKSAKARITELSKKYGLEVNPDAMVEDLSIGEKQRVEILKALYKDVEVLILDEPTAVLTLIETEYFFDVLRKLKEEGYSVIIITHRMHEIMSISDKVSILRNGKKVVDLNIEETNESELSLHMLGRELENNFQAVEINKREVAISLKDVSIKKHHQKAKIEDISFEIMKGEIVGIAGVEGNGQNYLAEAICGIQKISEGKIVFEGKEITKHKVRERARDGISYISDDRHHDGLVLDMTVEENLILKSYDKEPFSKHSVFSASAIKHRAIEAIEKYSIKTSGNKAEKAMTKLMSGGNQQKVVLAREITEEAKLIVANQPTRGLDMGASEFVRTQLLAQRNQNKAVLLISADLDEIFALSDRIAVMYGGKILDILNKEDVSMEQIGLLMGGIKKEVQANEIK